MFVSINFYFRPYEFLFSSLSFFENAGSTVSIKKYHFGVVKIVSVSPLMFTLKNVSKNDFEINSCHSPEYCVNGLCISQNTNQVFEIIIYTCNFSFVTHTPHYECFYMKTYSLLIRTEKNDYTSHFLLSE